MAGFERSDQMVDSRFPVGRGAGLFGLVVGGIVVGIGFLAFMWAATYGYESFKDDIRTGERAYLLVRVACCDHGLKEWLREGEVDDDLPGVGDGAS